MSHFYKNQAEVCPLLTRQAFGDAHRFNKGQGCLVSSITQAIMLYGIILLASLGATHNVADYGAVAESKSAYKANQIAINKAFLAAVSLSLFHLLKNTLLFKSKLLRCVRCDYTSAWSDWPGLPYTR